MHSNNFVRVARISIPGDDRHRRQQKRKKGRYYWPVEHHGDDACTYVKGDVFAVDITSCVRGGGGADHGDSEDPTGFSKKSQPEVTPERRACMS